MRPSAVKCKFILPETCIVSQQCVDSQGPQEQDEMAGPLLSTPKDLLGLPAQVECARREAITQTAHPHSCSPATSWCLRQKVCFEPELWHNALIIPVVFHMDAVTWKTTRHWYSLPQTINYLQNGILWICDCCSENDCARGSVFQDINLRNCQKMGDRCYKPQNPSFTPGF